MLAKAHNFVQYERTYTLPDMISHLKVGIIQNAPLTADFPNNLRSIVQGYRECLDHGAELVVAPATALCGPRPGALAQRRSFLKQTQAALEALSHELGDAPLLLGAYAPLFPDEGDDWDTLTQSGGLCTANDGLEDTSCGDLVPFLLERDTVTELSDAEVTDIAGLAVYVDICTGEVLPEEVDFDLLIHLADSPWHANAARQDDENRRWEARSNNVPVIYAQAVGTAGGQLYAGGSGIYNAEGSALLRLPFFEPATRVADIAGTAHARALPRAEELLEQALERGIRDSVLNNGYNSVALLLDAPNAPLLAALCTEALGAAKVQGYSFMSSENSSAAALGISIEKLDATPVLSAAGAEEGSPLATRLQAALLTQAAQDQGHMLLCPLGRHEIMLGSFTLYGESCGLLAPLGNLYRMDIHLLTQLLGERYAGLTGTLAEPAQPEQDRIIHELADRNIAPSELLANNPILFPENDVRFVQRRLIASALKREQLPTVLHVDAPSEQLELPVNHRLND